MNRTAIEWVKNPDGSPGYTWNPITGCLNHVNGMCRGGNFPCYAYRLAHGRLKQRYLANRHKCPLEYWNTKSNEFPSDDPFYPRFWPERLKELNKWPNYRTQDKAFLGTCKDKPKGIFICDMGERFGDWIPEWWQKQISDVIKEYHWHRFYTLTKQPQNLAKWSPFPDNCWVGVTACNDDMFWRALARLKEIEARIKYISIEPYLDYIRPIYELKGVIDWLIIGAWTGSLEDAGKMTMRRDLSLKRWVNKWTVQPKIECFREIVEAADKAGITVFLKDNLKPLLESQVCNYDHNLYWRDGYYTSPEHPNVDLHLRQEMPK